MTQVSPKSAFSGSYGGGADVANICVHVAFDFSASCATKGMFSLWLFSGADSCDSSNSPKRS